MISIHSSIQTSLKRFVLFRGTFFAGMGALLILFAGISLPRDELDYWGLFIILAAFALIALGLIPYRRLSRLETNPYEVILNDTSLIYSLRGKKIYIISRLSIDRLDYCSRGRKYGLGIWLKHPLPEKVVIHRNRFKIFFNQIWSRNRFGCDLFLPYFSERSLNSLKLKRYVNIAP